MSFRPYDILRLIQDFGETFTLRKVTTSGSYDTALGEVTGSATTDYAFLGYLFNNNGRLSDEVEKDTRKLAISPLGLSAIPDYDDIIIGGNATVHITGISELYSDGNVVCYICNVVG